MPRGRKPPGAPNDPRGGPRTGTPGHSYPQRSDLRAQPVQAATGQPYGARAAQEATQRQLPVAGAPGPPTTTPGAPGPWEPRISAGDVPNLTDPSRRPDEPLTAGLPFGAGPGPTLDQGPMSNPTAEWVRGVYMAFPTSQLRELLDQLAIEGG